MICVNSCFFDIFRKKPCNACVFYGIIKTICKLLKITQLFRQVTIQEVCYPWDKFYSY